MLFSIWNFCLRSGWNSDQELGSLDAQAHVSASTGWSRPPGGLGAPLPKTCCGIRLNASFGAYDTTRRESIRRASRRRPGAWRRPGVSSRMRADAGQAGKKRCATRSLPTMAPRVLSARSGGSISGRRGMQLSTLTLGRFWPGAEGLERAKGFEPSTPTLARLCSTPELHPHPDPTAPVAGRSPMPNGHRLCNRGRPSRPRLG